MTHYPITEEQIQFYETNGFVKLENVLTLAEVDELSAPLEVAVADRKRSDAEVGPTQDKNYERVFLQMVNLWENYPIIRKFVFDKVQGIVPRLLGIRTSPIGR